MRVETLTLITIIGMALVTYFTRVGGLWLMSRVEISPRLESCLTHLPGSILSAIAAPMVFAADLIGLTGVAATVLVAVKTQNLLLAILTGVGVVCALRFLQN